MKTLPAWASAALSSLEWLLTLAAVGLWVSARGYHDWLPVGAWLLLAGWLARWLRTGQLTRSTAVDLPLVLFLASALVAVWAAPQTTPALARMFHFLAAAGLFSLLVNASPRALALAGLGLVLAAAALAVYFATQHPWAEQSAKFALVGQAGLWLNRLVPDLGAYKPHPNVAASALAVIAPLAAGVSWQMLARYKQTRRPILALAAVAAAAGLLLIVFGLLMTESRAAWLGLGAAVSIGLWWTASGRLASAAPRLNRMALFWAGVGAAALSTLLAAGQRDLVRVIYGGMPGGAAGTDRISLYGQAWKLAQDTPYTGGGLDTFPALYSAYMVNMPFLQLTHAHNTYLNLLVEQGWPGMLSFAALLAAAAWAASRRLAAGPDRWLAAASLAGLAVVGVQGMADATLVASRAIVVLFVPAALAVAGQRAAEPAAQPPAAPAPVLRSRLPGVALAAAVAVVALAALLALQPLLAAWHANQGALAYARIELADWPTGQWSTGAEAGALAATRPEFEAALAHDPGQRTAHHRLGLLALLQRDFAAAAASLEQAHARDPQHRGIGKALGYAYAWLGQYDQAAALLSSYNEAFEELAVYQWWWETLDRNDLSEAARQTSQRLIRD